MDEDSALASLNEISKVLNEQDEGAWADQAETKYTQLELDKINAKTKKLRKKIKQREAENAEIEEENKKILDMIEKEKESIEILKKTNTTLLSKKKDDEEYLKSWNDKCSASIKEHEKRYEQYELSVKQRPLYKKLKEAENGLLERKIQYGLLKSKLDMASRINEKKKEMSQKIFTSAVVNFAKTCLDYNRNRNYAIKIKEMEAKYKKLVETYQDVQTKVLQKELEFDKRNRMANMKKNFETISQLGTKDLLSFQPSQEKSTNIASKLASKSPARSSNFDKNDEDSTKMPFKTSFADFAKNAVMQKDPLQRQQTIASVQNTTFAKPGEQRNILGPVTASFVNTGNRTRSPIKPQQEESKIKIFNEGPEQSDIAKENFLRKSQDEFLLPKPPLKQRSTLKRVNSSERPSPKRPFLTHDTEFTKTVLDGTNLQKTAPVETSTTTKPANTNTVDENQALAAQISENLIICSQPDELKRETTITSQGLMEKNDQEIENTIKKADNLQEKFVSFAGNETNRNFLRPYQPFHTTPNGDEMIAKSNNGKPIKLSTIEHEKGPALEHNFPQSFIGGNIFGKNTTALSARKAESDVKTLERNNQGQFVSFQNRQATEFIFPKQPFYTAQKDTEIMMKPNTDKSSQSSANEQEKAFTLERNFVPSYFSRDIFGKNDNVQQDNNVTLNENNETFNMTFQDTEQYSYAFPFSPEDNINNDNNNGGGNFFF